MNIRKSIIVLTAGATLATGLTLVGCSAGGAQGAPAPSSGGAAAEAPAKPGLNTAVKAGAFEYTALTVKDAGTTAGTEPLSQTAQGTYVQVDLRVANTGDKAQTFIVNYVKLKDAAGKTYDADMTATVYAAGGAGTWVAAINPGNAVEGPVLFDVPAGTAPVTLVVSDNAFTGGTEITIG